MIASVIKHVSALFLVLYGYTQDLPPPEVNALIVRLNVETTIPDPPIILPASFQHSYETLQGLPLDSLKIARIAELAREVIQLQDTSLFYTFNSHAMGLAKKINHPYLMADIHWNWGEYYLAKFRYPEAFINYRNAERLFEASNHSYYRAKMFYNMGYIESLVADYSRAEMNLLMSLSIFKELDKRAQIMNTYNLLGSVYDGMEDYAQAIFYYQAALDMAVNGPHQLYPDLLNNLGVVHQKMGSGTLAIDNFKRALGTPDLRQVHPELYARLLDNLAYARFVFTPAAAVEQDLLTALRLRDSLQHLPSIIISHLHLSDYYKAHDQIPLSRAHAEKALEISSSKGLHRDQMGALKRLSILEPHLATEHLTRYIGLADALRKNENKQREKFARIQYETDDYIKANARLSQQKLLWIAIAIIFLILLVFIYWSMSLRIHNKQLHFAALQQDADEAIYAVRIEQWRQGEKARQEERERLAEELHDSVLTQLFGMRLNWEVLDLENNTNDFHSHSQSVLKIEQQLRALSHNLIQEPPYNQALLIENLEVLLQQKSHQGNFDYRMHCEQSAPFEALNEQVKMHLFRIVEEALHNIVKHAVANKVVLSLQIKDHFIIIISDNGSGFREGLVKKGLGLRNMRARSEKINGVFHLVSGKKGTTITIKLKHQDHGKPSH
ncbi:MAG: tetratricopeptide repeat-containing sensor histidine kinase [Gelidibacter sp.]